MLLERCDILTMKNGNLSLLSKCLYIKMLSLIVSSKSRKVGCVSCCSTFSSSSLGYMFLKVLKNSLGFYLRIHSGCSFFNAIKKIGSKSFHPIILSFQSYLTGIRTYFLVYLNLRLSLLISH